MLQFEDDHEKIPGLFSAWELPQILLPGEEYRIEDGGETADGCRLLMVFRRVPQEGLMTEDTAAEAISQDDADARPDIAVYIDADGFASVSTELTATATLEALCEITLTLATMLNDREKGRLQ